MIRRGHDRAGAALVASAEHASRTRQSHTPVASLAGATEARRERGRVGATLMAEWLDRLAAEPGGRLAPPRPLTARLR